MRLSLCLSRTRTRTYAHPHGRSRRIYRLIKDWRDQVQTGTLFLQGDECARLIGEGLEDNQMARESNVPHASLISL